MRVLELLEEIEEIVDTAAGFPLTGKIMIDSEELVPVLGVMQEALGMDPEKTRQVFLTVALFAHGYASIIANNGLEFDEAVIARHLEQAWNGALRAAREDMK